MVLSMWMRFLILSLTREVLPNITVFKYLFLHYKEY